MRVVVLWPNHPKLISKYTWCWRVVSAIPKLARNGIPIFTLQMVYVFCSMSTLIFIILFIHMAAGLIQGPIPVSISGISLWTPQPRLACNWTMCSCNLRRMATTCHGHQHIWWWPWHVVPATRKKAGKSPIDGYFNGNTFINEDCPILSIAMFDCQRVYPSFWQIGDLWWFSWMAVVSTYLRSVMWNSIGCTMMRKLTHISAIEQAPWGSPWNQDHPQSKPHGHDWTWLLWFKPNFWNSKHQRWDPQSTRSHKAVLALTYPTLEMRYATNFWTNSNRIFGDVSRSVTIDVPTIPITFLLLFFLLDHQYILYMYTLSTL